MSGFTGRVLIVVCVVLAWLAAGHAQQPQRLNRMIALLEKGQPVFGVHLPSPGPPRGSTAAPKTPEQLAKEGIALKTSDFYYETTTEESLDPAIKPLTDFITATLQEGNAQKIPHVGLVTPIVTKVPKLLCMSKTSDADGCKEPAGRTAAKGAENIHRLLNTGVAGLFYIEVESAEEAKLGVAAMRFKSKGGSRPETDLGAAPAFWGMTKEEYLKKADVWPLNPEGELINWTMIETAEGLRHTREIAAVKGISVLWIGLNSVRQMYTSKNAAGETVVDTAAIEKAAQTVLAACKEFHVVCAIPPPANDIEKRLNEGWKLFALTNSQALETGRKASGRSATN